MATYTLTTKPFGAAIQKEDGKVYSNQYTDETVESYYGNVTIKVDNAFLTITPNDTLIIDGETVEAVNHKAAIENAFAGSSASTTSGDVIPSPDGRKWVVGVTDVGGIVLTEYTGNAAAAPIVRQSPDGSIWTITASNNGGLLTTKQ